jgi:hypothetical protein
MEKIANDVFYEKFKKFLLFFIAICYVGSAFCTTGSGTGAIDGTVEFGESANSRISIPSKIGKTGKIVNKSSKLRVAKEIETQVGDNIGHGVDEATGAIHNHDSITIESAGVIKGAGTLYNYTRFVDDVRTSASYSISDYDAGRHLDSSVKLGLATYYDLVNDGGVRKFKIYQGGKIIVPGTSGTTMTLTDRPDGRYVQTMVNVTEERFDPFSEGGDTAIDIGSARRYYGPGYTFITESNSQKDIAASFFNLNGYTQYAQRVVDGDGVSDSFTIIGSVSQPRSSDSRFKFNLAKTASGLSYTPVFVSACDESLVIRKTGTTAEYVDSVKRNASVFKFEDWNARDPVVKYSGDNSWYNGVFELKEGGAIIDERGSIFGGKIVMYPFTELEWRGGPKDEFNRPTIIMQEGSSLFFNLRSADETFSFYGNIKGDESARLIFENGTVLVKGDLSEFKGTIVVVRGGKFIVTSSDATSSSEYEGKFPGGVIYQTEANGELATAFVDDNSATTIDTATGVENLNINNGYTIVKNSDATGTVALRNSSVSKGAFVSMDGKSEIKKSVIEGVVIVKGDMDAQDVTINGGVLAFEGGSLTTENLTAGSTIAFWGNRHTERINVQNSGASGGTTFTITDGHTLKFYADVNPSTNQIDQINTLNDTIVNPGNGIQIGGLNFMNKPTADEYYFDVLTGAAVNTTPITIGAVYGTNPATFAVYDNATFTVSGGGSPPPYLSADTIYTYTATGAAFPVTLSDGVGIVDIDGRRYYIYGSEYAGPGKILITTIPRGILPIEMIHLSGLNMIPSIYDIITDYGYIEKEEIIKYNFWNKTFAEIDKYPTSGNSSIKSHDYGTIFGFDAKPTQLQKYNAFIMPTIFGGTVRRNITYNSFKAKQEEYIVGGKLALFNKKVNTELITSYGFMRTKLNSDLLDIRNLKSHLFSVGGKLGYNIQMNKCLSLRPDILADYSLVKTAKVNSSLIKNIKNGNIHRIDVVPGLSLVCEKMSWKTILSVKHHSRFGTKSKIVAEKLAVKNEDKLKKSHMEYAIDITKHGQNKGKFGIKLAKTTHGINGFKATTKIGIKF